MILRTITQEKVVEVPVALKCDICGRVVELESKYDLEYRSKVSDQMAVVKYGHPGGGLSNDTVCEELHCCSTECVTKAIKRVPFDATITIPMSEKFIK